MRLKLCEGAQSIWCPIGFTDQAVRVIDALAAPGEASTSFSTPIALSTCAANYSLGHGTTSSQCRNGKRAIHARRAEWCCITANDAVRCRNKTKQNNFVVFGGRTRPALDALDRRSLSSNSRRLRMASRSSQSSSGVSSLWLRRNPHAVGISDSEEVVRGRAC